jgi:DNA polymerase-3 subunit epsilon
MQAFPETFCIVDTETSGMRPATARVIDIGIIRVEKGKVVERYQTLLNPGHELPPYIESLTHIRTEDLQNAPTFEEVAIDIESLLQGAVFMAHNASFDYRFIQSEFRRMGKTWKAQSLCTVSLSRRLFPKERGHNLDALISRFGLVCDERHRALPDAEVLLQFCEHLNRTLDHDDLARVVQSVLTGGDRASSVSRKTFTDLPDSAGVYFFYGEDDELLYIGKSKNVRTRARSHFHKSSEKKEKYIQQETTTIETISTSGELSALLLESALIKRESPLYNKALRKRRQLVIAKRAIGEDGYSRVSLTRTEDLHADPDILGVFKTITQAKTKLRDLCKSYSLCPKLLGIEVAQGACFSSQIGVCDGACKGKVQAEEYNQRVQEAFEKRKLRIWPYKGAIRITEQENEEAGSIFFIKDWVLMGAFKVQEGEFQTLLPEANSFDYDTYKILARYILNRKNRGTIQVLNDSQYKKELAECRGSFEAVVQ